MVDGMISVLCWDQEFYLDPRDIKKIKMEKKVREINLEDIKNYKDNGFSTVGDLLEYIHQRIVYKYHCHYDMMQCYEEPLQALEYH